MSVILLGTAIVIFGPRCQKKPSYTTVCSSFLVLFEIQRLLAALMIVIIWGSCAYVLPLLLIWPQFTITL
jgi:hypothetical protein